MYQNFLLFFPIRPVKIGFVAITETKDRESAEETGQITTVNRYPREKPHHT